MLTIGMPSTETVWKWLRLAIYVLSGVTKSALVGTGIVFILLFSFGFDIETSVSIDAEGSRYILWHTVFLGSMIGVPPWLVFSSCGDVA